MRVRLLVSGRVQGVGFREFTWRTARRAGVGGWVRNLPDGRVEIVAEGERTSLEALVAAVMDGPPGAAVRDVQQDWQDAPAPSTAGRTAQEKEFVIR